MRVLPFCLAVWCTLVHGQVVEEFDRVVGPREKSVAVGSAEDWIAVHFENHVFLWREYGSSLAGDTYWHSLPTAFWHDRESGELYQFHGSDVVDAVIQLSILAPELSVADLIHSDVQLWSL
ncbi:MAG: hypothetical protein AABZ47_10280, partial [Planctomycetota bacterium]